MSIDEIAKKYNINLTPSLKKEVLRIMALSISPQGRAIAAMEAKRQEEIIKIIMVLPNKYRYEQVEAAINASGASPDAIYRLVTANDRTETLARFYETLNGSGGNEK